MGCAKAGTSHYLWIYVAHLIFFGLFVCHFSFHYSCEIYVMNVTLHSFINFFINDI